MFKCVKWFFFFFFYLCSEPAVNRLLQLCLTKEGFKDLYDLSGFVIRDKTIFRLRYYVFWMILIFIDNFTFSKKLHNCRWNFVFPNKWFWPMNKHTSSSSWFDCHVIASTCRGLFHKARRFSVFLCLFLFLMEFSSCLCRLENRVFINLSKQNSFLSGKFSMEREGGVICSRSEHQQDSKTENRAEYTGMMSQTSC